MGLCELAKKKRILSCICVQGKKGTIYSDIQKKKEISQF